jgi:hypothetical protein
MPRRSGSGKASNARFAASNAGSLTAAGGASGVCAREAVASDNAQMTAATIANPSRLSNSPINGMLSLET